MKLLFNFRTPSAALYALTTHKQPYRWWGIILGRFFIGVMRSEAR